MKNITYSCNNCITLEAVEASRPVVGSSKNRTSGEIISSIPIPVLLISPPDMPRTISVPTWKSKESPMYVFYDMVSPPVHMTLPLSSHTYSHGLLNSCKQTEKYKIKHTPKRNIQQISKEEESIQNSEFKMLLFGMCFILYFFKLSASSSF